MSTSTDKNFGQRVSINPGEAINGTNETKTYTDLKNLRRLTKSNSGLMMELISVYLEQIPSLTNFMQQYFTEQNWRSLQATVHKMIPSFSLMGLDPAYEQLARKVQEYDYSQGLTDENRDMIRKLEFICSEVCTELKGIYDQLQKEQT